MRYVMATIGLALLVLPVSAKEKVDYKALCDSVQCWNKSESMCTGPDLKTCTDYDSQFGHMIIIRQQGRACEVIDHGQRGWIFCGLILYNSTPVKRP